MFELSSEFDETVKAAIGKPIYEATSKDVAYLIHTYHEKRESAASRIVEGMKSMTGGAHEACSR